MMTNFILLFGIFAAFSFAIYDQFIQPKRHGQTHLAVNLKKTTVDSWITIALLVLTISQGLQTGITGFTLYLLIFCIILASYLAFFRTPKLLLKEKGFFFGNAYIEYSQVAQINLATGKRAEKILVIDLNHGKRLFIHIAKPEDLEQVVQFFGGYK